MIFFIEMKLSFQKTILVIISLGVTYIAIELIPISSKASYWNRCIKTTSETLVKVPTVKSMNINGLEAIAVMICNGAVFEPKMKERRDK